MTPESSSEGEPVAVFNPGAAPSARPPPASVSLHQPGSEELEELEERQEAQDEEKEEIKE